MESVLRALERLGLRIRRDEPMCEHTSFRIGGPVSAMLFPDGEEQLTSATKLLQEADIPPLILGNGSNLLAGDAPMERIVIKTHDGVGKIEQIGETSIRISAGVLLSKAAVFAREAGLTGLEFAHGIPGTLGGAIVMNAGAYDSEMAQVTTKVHYVDQSRNHRTAENPDLAFSYRHSRFSATDDIILAAELTLSPADPAEI